MGVLDTQIQQLRFVEHEKDPQGRRVLCSRTDRSLLYYYTAWGPANIIFHEYGASSHFSKV